MTVFNQHSDVPTGTSKPPFGTTHISTNTRKEIEQLGIDEVWYWYVIYPGGSEGTMLMRKQGLYALCDLCSLEDESDYADNNYGAQSKSQSLEIKFKNGQPLAQFSETLNSEDWEYFKEILTNEADRNYNEESGLKLNAEPEHILDLRRTNSKQK